MPSLDRHRIFASPLFSYTFRLSPAPELPPPEPPSSQPAPACSPAQAGRLGFQLAWCSWLLFPFRGPQPSLAGHRLFVKARLWQKSSPESEQNVQTPEADPRACPERSEEVALQRWDKDGLTTKCHFTKREPYVIEASQGVAFRYHSRA